MKKSFLMSGLLIFAFCIMNVMATTPEKENASSNGPEMTNEHNNHPRPFIGTVSYTPSEVPHISYGVGNATHMGRITAVSHCDIDFMNGEDTFTAADGSKATMIWHFDYLNPTYSDGYGTWEWTVGTGRFSDISGSGTFIAVLTATTIDMELKGTIAY